MQVVLNYCLIESTSKVASKSICIHSFPQDESIFYGISSLDNFVIFSWKVMALGKQKQVA